MLPFGLRQLVPLSFLPMFSPPLVLFFTYASIFTSNTIVFTEQLNCNTKLLRSQQGIFVMNDKLIIENILFENNINQQQLADMLGIKKQAISSFVTGKRNISAPVKEKIKKLFPDISFDEPKVETKEWLIDLRKSLGLTKQQFADRIQISQTLYSKLETGDRNITKDVFKRIKLASGNRQDPVGVKINYCPDVDFLSGNKVNKDNKIVIDEMLLTDKNDTFKPDDCYVISLNTDDLKPMFNYGDRVIVVLNEKVLKNDCLYILYVNGNYYARKVVILPDKVKCISTNNDEDTFTLSDAKGALIMCRIIPQIRL